MPKKYKGLGERKTISMSHRYQAENYKSWTAPDIGTFVTILVTRYIKIMLLNDFYIILCYFYIAECTFIILDKHVYLITGSERGMYLHLQYPSVQYLSFDQFISDAMVGDTNLFLHDLQGLFFAEIEIMIADEANRSKKRGWESVILMLLYGNSTTIE